MSDAASEAKVEVTPPSIVPLAGGSINLTLTGEFVLLPLAAYDSLLGTTLAVQRGEYVSKAEVEERIRKAVKRVMLSLNSSLKAASEGLGDK